jgi:hypothetical protein
MSADDWRVGGYGIWWRNEGAQEDAEQGAPPSGEDAPGGRGTWRYRLWLGEWGEILDGSLILRILTRKTVLQYDQSIKIFDRETGELLVNIEAAHAHRVRSRSFIIIIFSTWKFLLMERL